MFAKDFLADDERAVDTQLGYPRGYVKLCRHAYIQMQGLITPFTEGPPQRFHPYAPLDEELAKLKEFDALFPIIDEAERDPSNARRHAGFLWQQLDHLGNAGFDPAKFRVDAYGNVVYWNADPGSPLAWEVDHWFPHSRGGKTVLSNLRIVQWQVNQRKSTKLEFLVPWWDLQMGVSVNQFLSVFSSKNADFRQRAFALFFLGGENEQLDENLVVECHSWPQPFRERKHQLGLAAAALVKVQRHMDDTLKVLNSNQAPKQNLQQIAGAVTPARRRWTSDEEDALKRALQKFGPGHWKEIKEFEPMLVNRSTVQIKDKYRLMRGEWDKENNDIPPDRYMASMQREEQIKQARAEEIKQKEEELLQLEEELRLIKDHNEKEKIILEELEQSLGKQRKRVEKQRRWSETQSQYRLCLEKMIRDTMHQCVLFKEQARLNQAACNALLARLESQKSACDSAEMDLMKRVKQRESLEASARPKITKRTRKAGHADVGGCMKLNAGATKLNKDKTHGWAHKVSLSAEMDRLKDHKMHTVRRARVPDSPEQDSQDSEEPGCGTPSSKSPDQDQDNSHGDVDDLDADGLHTHKSMPRRARESLPSAKAGNADVLQKTKASDLFMKRNDSNQHEEDNDLDCQSQEGPVMIKKVASPTGSSESAGVKRKAVDPSDLDVALLRHEYEEDHAGGKRESVGGNVIDKNSSGCDHAQNATLKHLDRPKTKDDEQLDELLQEVLEMRGKVDAAMADAIEDDEDEADRVKRVGKFNLDKWLQLLLLPTKDAENSELAAQINSHAKTPLPKPQESLEAEESMRGGMIGDFLKKLSFKHGQADAERHNSAAEEPNLRVPEQGETVKGAKEIKAEENGQGIIRRHANAGPWGCTAGPSIKQAATVNAHAAPLQGKCSKTPCNDEGLKTEERKVIESFSRLKLSSNADVRPTPSMTDGSTENSEVAFQIACETEFVEKMRATRERELRRKRQASAGVPPKLQDLLEDSSQEPSQEQHVECGKSSVGMIMPSPSPTKATVQKLSPAKVKLDEQRRRSMGGPMKQQNQFTFPRQQHQLAMTPTLKRPQQQSFERTKQNLKHPQQSVRNPQCSSPRLQLQSQPLERSSSTPPAQFRHTPSTPPPQLTHRRQTGELPHQQQSSLQVPQLSRQLTTGHAAASGVVNSGGAARKASMLMKSASTRGTSAGGRTSSSGSVSSPARSSSSGGAGRRGGEGEPEVASIRRKASFFQDWDGNEGLRASLSHVWKKAVKKFDLARQQAHS